MNLDDFIIPGFCLIDEMVPMILTSQQLRTRGPASSLTDSEVITMEVVGSYLGLSQEKELFASFHALFTANSRLALEHLCSACRQSVSSERTPLVLIAR